MNIEIVASIVHGPDHDVPAAVASRVADGEIAVQLGDNLAVALSLVGCPQCLMATLRSAMERVEEAAVGARATLDIRDPAVGQPLPRLGA